MGNNKGFDLCGICGYQFGIELICPSCGHERSEISSKHCMNAYGEIETVTLLRVLRKKGMLPEGLPGNKNPLVELLVQKGILTEDEAIEVGKLSEKK